MSLAILAIYIPFFVFPSLRIELVGARLLDILQVRLQVLDDGLSDLSCCCLSTQIGCQILITAQ
jgi:hypothetical protein